VIDPGTVVIGIIWLLILWLVIGAWRLRRKRVTIGPAAAGAIDELLTDQRRAAIEIIVEDRTGERDPEDKDGNLPDLESPRK